MHLHWSIQNRKLAKLGAISFGIPAFRSSDGFVTCPGAGICAGVCYARRGTYLISHVKASRERNLAFLRSNSSNAFVGAAVQDLIEAGAALVRVHDSGDFFDQPYLDAWYNIARILKERWFYAYTKSLHLDLWSKKPTNFKLVQSEGGKFDTTIDPARPMARIFPDRESLSKTAYEECALDDSTALEGALKIGHVYHGRHFLTAAQRELFKP